MDTRPILWPARIKDKYAVGYFKGKEFIRISKYYNTETIMRLERSRLDSLPLERLAEILKSKES